MSATILIVDDEKEIADLIEVYLKNDGYGDGACRKIEGKVKRAREKAKVYKDGVGSGIYN